MDFDRAYKEVENYIRVAYKNADHQIEIVAIRGMQQAFNKVKCIEDIQSLHNEPSNFPNLDGEYIVRQHFEKYMGIIAKPDVSYANKLRISSLLEMAKEVRMKPDLSTTLASNASCDFYNENYLSK
jgi:hypothetical protein